MTLPTLFREYAAVIGMTIIGALWFHGAIVAGGSLIMGPLSPAGLLGCGLVGIYAVWKESRT